MNEKQAGTPKTVSKIKNRTPVSRSNRTTGTYYQAGKGILG